MNWKCYFFSNAFPIRSMYGLFQSYYWLFVMAKVGTYTIHWWYGCCLFWYMLPCLRFQPSGWWTCKEARAIEGHGESRHVAGNGSRETGGKKFGLLAMWLPSRGLTYPTFGKGKIIFKVNHLQNAIFGGYVSSLEGMCPKNSGPPNVAILRTYTPLL